MNRAYNLSAGPAILPVEVLEKAQAELLNYNNSGMSVMELSHRSGYFEEIIEAAEANLRQLLNIPDNYKVLFLQGGASMVFTTLPLNLRQKGKVAYDNGGNFGKKAMQAAVELEDAYNIEVDVVASSAEDSYTHLPELSKNLSIDYDYLHICSNNTIEGTQYKTYPQYEGVPLVADMSSDLLSKPVDVTQFGMIYAGAQKNAGIAGLTLVIIRDDLLGLNEDLPTIFNYNTFAKANSLYNTPSTYPIYIHKLITDWLIEEGGLEAVAKRNEEKAQVLYDYLDQSQLFKSPVKKEDRSVMNVPFVTGDADLDAKFIALTEENGFQNLKGHRSVGGMRASIYNAFPLEGVKRLVELMAQFEKEHQ